MNITVKELKQLYERNPRKILNTIIQTEKGEYVIIAVVVNLREQRYLIALTKDCYYDCVNVKNYHSICNNLINAPKDTILARNPLLNSQNIITLPSLSTFLNYKHYCYISLSNLDNNLNDDDIIISLNTIQQYIIQIQNELI
jgi:hypothetical protein